MNTKRIASGLLLCLLTILPVLLVIMIYHLSVCRVLENDNGLLFGKETTASYIEGQISSSQIIDIVNKVPVPVAFNSMMDMGSFSVVELYYNDYFVDMPLISGRFFRKSDISSTKPLAVIGKNYQNHIYKRGNSSFININDVEYKVIGIMGIDAATFLDNYIYINLSSITTPLSNITVSMDYFQETDGMKFINDINSIGVKCSFSMYGSASHSKNFFTNFRYTKIFVLLIVCTFFCLLIALTYWLSLHKKEIGMKRLTGIYKKDIVIHFYRKLLLYFAISLTFSNLLCYIKFENYLVNVDFGYLLLIIIFFLFVPLYVNRYAKDNISEVIR
ncbi:MAG: ABC transporter permease [Lachnospiraceae bacterium]|nr:ABC transporter permease [Lachnospiraceae bacterium]